MKRFVFGLATCAIALASCSTNDVLEQGSGSNNPNVINFSATTTRATVNNLDNVKTGFPVYAVTTNPSAWHISGQTYKFVNNTWKWFAATNLETPMAQGPQWPALDKFPMNFYAYYPATHAGYAGDAPIKGDADVLTSVITIQPIAKNQADYLAAKTPDIARIPQGGSVPLAFKHITAKINFGVIAAAGTKSHVQQMNINNVKNQGTYDYVTANDWTIANDAISEAKYDYWETATANIADAKGIKDFLCDIGVTEQAAPFYPATSADHHLMLLPQVATPVWTPQKYTGGNNAEQNEIMTIKPAGKTITPLKAYIGSVYRMENTSGEDLVGYANASNHPNYNDLPVESKWKEYTGSLFVKVGFPLNNGFEWVMGKAYIYNISLGAETSTGGYILDDRYYDDKGNPTDLTINGKDPGEPVSGGTINFDVTVGEWTDETVAPIQ